MKILPMIVLLACVACQTSARAQDEEGRAVSPRGGLLKRGLNKKQTTTTTTPLPLDDAEYEDEDYAAEGEAQEPSTEAAPSSTEGKKLVGGGVRPFRSNADLLESLKRRRAQAAEAKLHGHSAGTQVAAASQSQSQDAPTEAPVKANYNINKKRFNTPARESNNEDSPAPAKPSRGRFGRPAQRSIPEQQEPEEQNEPVVPTRTGRGFRRGGN